MHLWRSETLIEPISRLGHNRRWGQLHFDPLAFLGRIGGRWIRRLNFQLLSLLAMFTDRLLVLDELSSLGLVEWL